MLPVFILFSSFSKPALSEAIIKTSIYCDHFDACPSGKKRLEQEIVFVKGVKSVSFNTTEMTITVKYNPKKTDIQKIRTAISKAGYDADDVKADPKAAGKLDDCCRKKE